jgi:hypothetical protein
MIDARLRHKLRHWLTLQCEILKRPVMGDFMQLWRSSLKKSHGRCTQRVANESSMHPYDPDVLGPST